MLTMKARRDLLEDSMAACRFFVEIEPSPSDPDPQATYQARIDERRAKFDRHRSMLRQYALQHAGSIELMREAFYAISNQAEFTINPVAVGVVRAELDVAFHGIGEWQT